MNAIVLVACLGVFSAPLQALPRQDYEGRFDSITLQTQLDLGAILRTWKIKGVLVCLVGTKPHACLWVENAYPCGLFEVVRQPFRSHLKEGEAWSAVLKRLAGPLQSSHSGELQFADVRVWGLVPELVQDLDIPIAAPQSSLIELEYVSELDAFAWRNEWIDLVVRPGAVLSSCERRPSAKRCAGRWGSYDPRVGFVVRSNEVMAAHLQALRGGRVASAPSGRIVLSQRDYEPRTGHYVQMISPVRREVVSIGSAKIAQIERKAGSKSGAFLFVHFGIFEVCQKCLPVRLTEARKPE